MNLTVDSVKHIQHSTTETFEITETRYKEWRVMNSPGDVLTSRRLRYAGAAAARELLL